MTSPTLERNPVAGSKAAAAEKPRSESRIDTDSHFNGLYETRQDLRIEGVAEGEIRCEGTLTVAEGARVKAKVTASTITIAGDLEGEVVCNGVFQIMPTGRVDATVSARRLSVQEGGLYNGEFRMITDKAPAGETARPRPAAASSEVRPAAASAETAEETGPDIGSDEWWAKIANKDTPVDDKPSSKTDRDSQSKRP